MDRFLGLHIDRGTINSRNEIENYERAEQALREKMCRKRISEPKKKGSYIKLPKSKPINKKSFMNNIQNEIEVGMTRLSFP